jgi:high-affinity iron transporter
MFLSSVILVLREVLEAALLFALLLAYSRFLELRFSWVVVGLVVGFAGATVYALQIGTVSQWFGYVGQEVVNATLQLGIYLCFLAFAVCAARYRRGLFAGDRALMLLMALTIALAISREGSEIIIYLSGFLQLPDMLRTVVAGGALGAGIGISAGAMVYFGLLALGRHVAGRLGAALLVLVAGGMVAQATQLLTQADWIPGSLPAWDSAWLVEESTVTGQLLYALVGYEATPTWQQLAAYASAVAVFVGTVLGLGRGLFGGATAGGAGHG